MITLVQLVIAFSFSLITDSGEVYASVETVTLQSEMLASPRTVSSTPKKKVFQILENKCNVCHSKRNRRRVFTIDNMNLWAKDIYKQMFVKKRMPKGKKIKLTSQEYQDVLTWISTTKNQ